MKKIKGLISIILVILLMLSAVSAVAAQSSERSIRILIGNRFLETDQDPVLTNGRTLVPMRAIFESLGATVTWDDATSTATGVKDGKTVALTIDKSAIIIDGEEKSLDVAPQLINNRTMVPVRAIAEAFDCTVSWNGYKEYVVITPSNQQSYKIEAINEENETVATALYNEKGQLVRIEGRAAWFMPFMADINGNSYIDLVNSAQSVDFVYEGNNVSEIKIEKPYARGYKCTYDSNNCLIATQYVYGDMIDVPKQRTYVENKIQYPKSSYGSNLMVTINFNDMGLTDSYDLCESGMSGRMTYNENGTMSSWLQGPNRYEYLYDSENKLFKAQTLNMGMVMADVTYRYIK